MAQRPLIEGMTKVKDSYNVSSPALAGAEAAMADQGWLAQNVSRIRATRARLTQALHGLGFYCWPSQTNFLLTRPPDGNAGVIYESLKARGILVRYFNEPALDDKLRITVGTDEQNARLLASLREQGAGSSE